MKHLSTLALIGIASSCSSYQLAPPQERKAEYIEQTGVDRAVAYKRALTHLAKSFGDANKAIQLKDESTGQIIANANVSCNALRPALIVYPMTARFTLDFQAKDGRARIAFEDVTMHDHYGNVASYGQIANNEAMNKVKAECLDQVRSGLLGAVKSAGTAKADF